MARRRSTAAQAGAVDEEQVRDRIAQKAHELYERRGCNHGRDVDDWLEAERLVQQEFRQPPAQTAGRA